MNNYINLRKEGLPVEDKIFYNNKISQGGINEDETFDEDGDITNYVEVPNSILEDQFTKLKKRNHYLRISTLNIDSKNRISSMTVNSNQLFYNKLGFLISRFTPSRLFVYQPDNELKTGNQIYWQNVSQRLKTINGIPISVIQYDQELKTPIFNIFALTNKEMLNFFSWSFLNPLVQEQYDNELQFVNDTTTSNFYYFFYVDDQTLTASDWIYIDSTKEIQLFVILNTLVGYPTSSYYKIIPSRILTNIYKIKLLDIKIPDLIFNINNTNYNVSNYKYLVNGTLRILLEDNSYLVSNIDYIGDRIKYDFFYKDGIYNINDYNNNVYAKSGLKSIQKNIYPDVFLGTNIYNLLNKILPIITNNSKWLNYLNNNIFELAYFFLVQYNLYYQNYNFINLHTFALDIFSDQPNNTFYIYTVDLIKEYFNNKNNQILLKPADKLNNKMPEIYLNDYALYVNNETYRLKLKIVNWLDQIFHQKNDPFAPNDDFIETVINIDGSEIKLGKVLQYATENKIQNIYYDLGIYPFLPNFTALNTVGSVFALSNWSSTNFLENKLNSYSELDSMSTLYYYKASYSASTYSGFISNFYKYEYLVFREITSAIVLSKSINQFQYPKCYIFGLLAELDYFNPNDYVSKILYSKPNNTVSYFNQNSIISYMNFINGQYYYIAYVYDQKPFSYQDSIYTFDGIEYSKIGAVVDYFDVFTYIRTTEPIPNYYDGQNICSLNLTKINKLIRYQLENVYIAVYNTNSLVLDNYCSYMFYAGEKLYDDTNTYLGVNVSACYQYIGQIQDVRYTLALDASQYLSEEQNYNVVGGTKSNFINVTPTLVIPLDNIRIIETKTQTKYNVINYVGKTLVLKSKVDIEEFSIILYNQIINQPILDRDLNLFIFYLSIKDPLADIPKIYQYKIYEGFIDDTIIGTAYSISYAPLSYNIIIEKADDFQIQYLQNWAKYIYPDTTLINSYYTSFPRRNYIIQNPERTNLTGLETFELYPKYDIQLDNGYYTDDKFVEELNKKLNNIQYLEYNYYRKQVEYIDDTNIQVNNANYEKNRFKTIYNNTTREIDIRCYKVLNRLFYTAYYNPISPYIYFKIENANIENNVRIYIEVLRDAANNNYTNTIKTQLDREFTTRILPIFNYELRVISPLPTDDFIETIPLNIRKDLDSAKALLSKIGLEPFNYRKDYPNLTKNRRNAGQMLKNVYSNSWSYVSGGKTMFNPGVPMPFHEDELVLLINNVYYNLEQYKLGRVVNINNKVSNEHGNYNVYIQMVGDTKVSHPFWIGDIIYGLESGAIAMVVPYEWGMLTEYPEIAQLHSGLPSVDTIKMGYKNYIKYLFKYSGRTYLLDYLQKYNLQAFNEYNFLYQSADFESFRLIDFNPFLNWPIQEVKNCFRGFEIYFEYPVAFKIKETDLVLNFLKENRYCLFLGKNQDGIYDTPKDIMGFEQDQILTISDYQNNTKAIPWNREFNNLAYFNKTSITQIYLSYGSDNILQNKLYLKVNTTRGYSVGDTVRLKDINVRPTIQKAAFNIYNTTNYNIKMMISFEMYLSYILFRLVFIKLGISIPLGPNDYMRLTNKNTTDMTQIVNSLYYEPSTTNVLAYTNFILENYGTIITSNNLNYTDPDLTNNLYMSENTPLVDRISIEVANIINLIILNRILKWFVEPNNLLLWTKGDRQTYVFINEDYIDFSSKTIYRFELEILDSFIFQSNLLVKDSNGNTIGRVTYNNLYKNYYPNNNTFYTIYIKLAPGYVMNLNSSDYIYAEDMYVKNRIKNTPVLINSNNNYVYLYDTYLKFRSVFQIANDNITTLQDALNFNSIDSINSVFFNLFNLNNQSAQSFKNGYYISIARNEIYFDQPNNINGTFRIMLNLLDNKNVLRICEELGLIANIDIINNSIVNQKIYKLKDISLIKNLMDVCQLIIDLSPINTFLVDLVWNEHIENEIFSDYRYQVRNIDNYFSIIGARNVYSERIKYKNIYIYGDPDTNPNALVIPYLNKIFTDIYSNEYMKIAKETNTIESSMCNWREIYLKNSSINSRILLFDETEDTPFCYGILWVDMNAGDDTAYVVFPLAWDVRSNKVGYTVNRNNLANYTINLNFIYVDQQRSIDVQTLELTQMNQTNIIKSINPVLESIDVNYPIPTFKYDVLNPDGLKVTSELKNQYRIFKLKFMFPIKYDIIRGTPVLIKDYYTTLYKEPNSSLIGQNQLFIQKNWTDASQFNLQIGTVININYGSYNSIYLKYINSSDNIANQLYSFDNSDIIHEETNVVLELNLENELVVDGKTYIQITLENPIKYNFKSGLPVIFSYFPMNMQPQIYFSPDYTPWENILYNNNNIVCNCLSTQNIIVNGEWYTKIFYQSEHNLDLYGINPGGIQGISCKTKQQIYISGMFGIVSTNIGFQQIERNYLNSNLVNLEEYQNNSYIKPVPDGVYDIELIQKEDGITILSSNNYDINIPGQFDNIYNTNTPEQQDEYVDNNQNYRWFYVIEDNNLDISGLSGQGLYQYTLVDSILGSNVPPSNENTRMDYLVKIQKIELTNYIVNQETLPYLYGKKIYRVYGKVVISNLSSRFLLNVNKPSVVFDSNQNQPDYPQGIFLTDINKQYKIGIIYYLYNDSLDFNFNNNLPKYNYYNIIIKGRYRGFGGTISLNTKNRIFSSIDYKVSNIVNTSNIIELDLENNNDIYCSFYRFNSYGNNSSTIYDVYKQNYNKNSMYLTQINPIFTGFQQIPYQYNTSRDEISMITNSIETKNINEIINYYDIYPSRVGYIAENGIIYKTQVNKPFSTDILDYIYVCFKNIDSNIIVDQNNPIGNKVIFAKVYINKKLNNYDLDYTNYEVIYDLSLLPRLTELEIFFLDKEGYLVNFSNLDNNLLLEIHEYVERVKNINTRNGMIY